MLNAEFTKPVNTNFKVSISVEGADDEWTTLDDLADALLDLRFTPPSVVTNEYADDDEDGVDYGDGDDDGDPVFAESVVTMTVRLNQKNVVNQFNLLQHGSPAVSIRITYFENESQQTELFSHKIIGNFILNHTISLSHAATGPLINEFDLSVSEFDLFIEPKE